MGPHGYREALRYGPLLNPPLLLPHLPPSQPLFLLIMIAPEGSPAPATPSGYNSGNALLKDGSCGPRSLHRVLDSWEEEEEKEGGRRGCFL